MASCTPPKKVVKLKIVCAFESNRLSADCLASAYELVLPLVSKSIKQKPGKNQERCQDETEMGVMNHG